LACELGVRGEEGQSLRVLGLLEMNEGTLDTSKICLQKSTDILSEIGEEYEWARTQVAFAQLHIVEKKNADAINRLDMAEVVFDKLDARLDMASITDLRQLLL